MPRSFHIAPVVSMGLAIAGCAPMNHAQSTAMVGSGLGALTGAVVGSDSGHAAGGALIGAAIGAVAGGAMGHAEDHREAEAAAIRQAAYVEQVRHSLTNFDLIRMAQSGLGDEVIISSIQARGGQFDLGTDALVTLKSNGVSDRVIVAMQQSVQGLGNPVSVMPPAVVPPGGPVVMQAPPAGMVPMMPPSVVVQPAPVFIGPPPGPALHFEFNRGPRRRHYH